eukprot:4728934-Alexandrium_andersonii.AAC.1
MCDCFASVAPAANLQSLRGKLPRAHARRVALPAFEDSSQVSTVITLSRGELARGLAKLARHTL